MSPASSWSRVPAFAVTSFVLAAFLVAPAVAQVSGSAFVTDKSGSTVNANKFKFKKDVFLGGGPNPGSPCSSTGLPDGQYYFQVTNPSGSVLLSSDPLADRVVTVLNGKIAGANVHSTRNGACPGSKVVELEPFEDTPSSGNEYKAWLTRVSDHTPGKGTSGFISKFSKTDNFKVEKGKPVDEFVLSGIKFFDHNEDGVYNPSAANPKEQVLPGWRVEIYKDGALEDFTFTDANGEYRFIRPLDGTVYEIIEAAPGGLIEEGLPGSIWFATTPISAFVTATAGATGPDFGNLSVEVKPGVGRTIGFWHNNNGAIELMKCDPEWRAELNVLCLRHPIVTADPLQSIYLVPDGPNDTFAIAHNSFANWIVGNPTSGHAAYQLSRQMAATVLNNRCGFMQFTTYVDVRGDGVLISLDDLIAGATGLLCDPLAGLTGPQATDPAVVALRNTILACLNEFGGINETGDLTADQIVYGPSDEPSEHDSPYDRREDEN